MCKLSCRHTKRSRVYCMPPSEPSLSKPTPPLHIPPQAFTELPGIRGLWSLKRSSSSSEDMYLLLSFLGQTAVLGVEQEQLAEVDVAGIDCDRASLHCGNVLDSHVLQVWLLGVGERMGGCRGRPDQVVAGSSRAVETLLKVAVSQM